MTAWFMVRAQVVDASVHYDTQLAGLLSGSVNSMLDVVQDNIGKHD